MARTADDNYNPTPSEAPSTQAPNDLLSVRASPQDFGSQIGEAAQGLGRNIGEVGKQTVDYVLKQQGMLNETLSTNADSQLQIDQANILNQYKSLEGLQAAGAYGSTVTSLQVSREKLRQSMPNPAAARAFDMLSLRSTGFAIRDAASHSATQIKKAHDDSSNAGMNLAIDQASRPQVAEDPQRFNDALQSTRFFAQQQLQSRGYIIPGPDGKVTLDDNGDPVFSNDENGKMASQVYHSYIQAAEGKIWANRIKTLAFDPSVGNVNKAYQVLQDNADSIPAATRAELVATLKGPLQNEGARQAADQAVGLANQGYNDHIASTDTGAKDIRDSITKQESGGRTTSPDSIDGAVGVHQILQATFNQFAKPGEDIHNAKDNEAVYNRIIDKYSQDYEGDPARIAVAYFSGPNNISPIGSPHPWISDRHDGNGKYVSSYVADVTNRIGKSDTTAENYMTQADYLRKNYSSVIQHARDIAASNPNADATSIDLAAQRTEQKVNDIIRQQELSVQADVDSVAGYIKGSNVNKQPVTNLDQLESAPSEIRNAWHNVMTNDYYKSQGIMNAIQANSRGVQTTYGTTPWLFLKRALGPSNAQDYIRSSDDLRNSIGPTKDSPLTNTGASAIGDEIKYRDQDANGRAFMDQEYKFFQGLHKETVPPFLFPRQEIGPAKLEEHFNQQLPSLLALIKAGRTSGKTAAQLFSPKLNGKDNPDYVGNSFDAPKQTLLNEEWSKAQAKTLFNSDQSTTKYDDSKIKSLDDVKQLIREGKITDKNELKQLLERHKFASQAPQVPIGPVE